MKLKVHKDDINDPTFIEVKDLLNTLLKDIPDTNKYVSKEELQREVDKLLKGLTSLSFFLNNGVFNLTSPINISANNAIESNEKIPIGTMYYDYVNDRVRIKKKKGWVTNG